MGWFWKTLLLLLIFQSPADGMELLQAGDDTLVDCIQSIVSSKDEIFSKGIRISVETESLEIRTKFRDTVDRFLAHYRGIVDIDSGESSTYSTEVRLIFLDSLKSFKLVVGRQHTADTSGGSMYHLVVLPVNTSMSTVEEILDFCLENYILHINVLIKDDNYTINLYTYYPYSATKCDDSTPRIHNRFTNGSFEWNKPLFPRKVDNFWQCPLRGIIWHFPPYLYVDKSQVSGMNAEVPRILAALMNFSVEFTESSAHEFLISPNKTFSGAPKLLAEGNADICFSPVACNNLVREHFAITRVYHMPVLIMITKKEPFSSLETLILPFDSTTWTILFIFVSAKWIGSILWRICSHGVDVPFGEHSSRVRTIAWLLSIIILQSCYEGSVFRFLQKHPNKPPVNDLQEAIKKNYKIIVDSNIYKTVVAADLTMPQLIPTKAENPTNIFDTFDKYEGKYGLFANRDFLTFINNEKYIVAKSPISTYMVCMMLPKYSFLTTELDIRFEQILENGLKDRIYKTNIGVDRVSKTDKADEKGFKVLSMYDLVGAFQLLAIMIGLSVGIFVMEILSKRWERLAVVIEFLERIL